MDYYDPFNYYQQVGSYQQQQQQQSSVQEEAAKQSAQKSQQTNDDAKHFSSLLQDQITQQRKQQSQGSFMNLGSDNVALTDKQIATLRQAYAQNPSSADAMRAFLANGSSADPETVKQFLGQMSGQLGLSEDQLAVLRGSGGAESLRQLFSGGSPLTENQAQALKQGIETILGALQGDPEAKASLQGLLKEGSVDPKAFHDIIGQVLNTQIKGDGVMNKVEGQNQLQGLHSYFSPENAAKLQQALASNPEAKSLFESLLGQAQPDSKSVQQLVTQIQGFFTPASGASVPTEFADKLAQFQMQLTPEQQTLLSRLSPEQIGHLATLSPQDLSSNAERLLTKLGLAPQELALVSSLKPEDLARLSDLRDMVAQYTKAYDGQAPQQGLPQSSTVGDFILAALNAPQPMPAGGSAQARIVEIGNLVAERILVTAPELNQKPEVMIVMKETVLPGTQVKMSRGEGGVLQLTFEVRGQDSSNLIHQNLGALKETLQNKLGESVNVSVKTEGEGKEENEGRSRGRRNLIDEQEDEENA